MSRVFNLAKELEKERKKNKKLQEENLKIKKRFNELQDRINFLTDRNIEKQEVIDKAIKYLEETTNNGMFELRTDTGEYEELLNILKGE